MNIQNHTVLGIDIGSSKISAIITRKENNHIEVIGVGRAKSKGIQKGLITNIDLATKSIKEAVNKATQIAGIDINRTVVSISGAYIETTQSYGVVNIPNKEISIDEINRVMQMANHNANELPDYEKIHIIPYKFKVDKQDNIDDPINMNGSRLEVKAHVILANEISLSNLKKAIQKAKIQVDNFIYAGYASSIAVLEDDEKQLGIAAIDLGANGCELNIFLDGNIVHSEFLEVGSNSITSDLAMALHTSLDVAEDIKLKYATLQPCANSEITIPKIADEERNRKVSLKNILEVIYARLEETFIIISKMVEKTNLQNKLGSGIVFTGGMSNVKGLQNLINIIFKNTPVRIANPKKLNGVFGNIYDSTNSVAIGLNLYEHGDFTTYEIGYEKELKHHHQDKPRKENKQNDNQNIKIDDTIINIKDIQDTKIVKKPKLKKKRFSKLKENYNKTIKKISKLF